MSVSIEEAFASLPIKLKAEQREIIKYLTEGKNVFGVLPTGYGKSACFGFYGAVMDKLYPESRHIVLVISPLKALMSDQVSCWTAQGIRCAAVTRDMSDEDRQSVLDCNKDLVFMSPEAAADTLWFTWVKNHKSKICLLAIDEAHCLTSWGNSFRGEYLKVPRLRLHVTAPVLLLTATVTQKMADEILNLLRLEPPPVTMVCQLPDRSNIFLEVQKTVHNTITKAAEWLVPHLRSGKTASKVIVYCRTISDVTKVYGDIMSELGKDAWLSDDHTVHSRIVEMFHSHLDPNSQKRTLSAFVRRDSNVRCVVATVAFGLGVQVPDVGYIFHWGPATDILSYWQEVGRCARDGSEGKAITLLYPRSVNKSYIDGEIIQMLEAIEKGTCVRRLVLEHLHLRGMSQDYRHTCEHPGCCSVCSDRKW